VPCRPMRPLCSGVGWTIRNTAELKALSFRRRSQIRRQKSSSFPNSQRPETKPKDGPRGPIVPKQSLEHSGEKLAESAEKIKRSTHGVQDSAARTTELAADRTVFAAERTYAAWVRTGLMALASGIGAKALLSDVIPQWLIIATGTVLVLFSAFCFGAAVWRHLEPGVPPPRLDVSRIPAWLLIAVNGFLALVALAALIGIWFGQRL